MELFMILAKVALAAGIIGEVAPEGGNIDQAAHTVAEVSAIGAIGAGIGGMAATGTVLGSAASVGGTAVTAGGAAVSVGALSGAVIGTGVGVYVAD